MLVVDAKAGLPFPQSRPRKPRRKLNVLVCLQSLGLSSAKNAKEQVLYITAATIGLPARQRSRSMMLPATLEVAQLVAQLLLSAIHAMKGILQGQQR